MKKHLLFLFAALLPMLASAQTKVEIDGIWYNLDESALQAEVTNPTPPGEASSYYSGEITIPLVINYNEVEYTVTKIGENAFAHDRITSVIIPESVTSIDKYAFWNCSLTSINIPKGVTSIGESAFGACYSLTSVTIPKSVTSIGSTAFNSPNLTSIVIEDGNEKYDSRDGCNAIIQTRINSLITGCSTTVIPESVTSIGKYAFEDCGFTAINIPKSVEKIGDCAFFSCEKLTTVTVADDSQLTEIGDQAFCYCKSLTTITIPGSVTSIGSGAFEYCSSLEEVHINNITAWCNIDFEEYWSTPFNSANKLFLNGELVKNLVIPATVTKIKRYAFASCESLMSVTISEGVTSIGEDAFYHCSNLTSVDVPGSVTDIGEYAFCWCDKLSSVTLSEGLWSIGKNAFLQCHSLTNITIPEGTRYIEKNAFENCTNLQSIVLPKSLSGIYSEAFKNCTELFDVYVHAESVPYTASDVFKGCYPEYVTLHVPANALNAYKTTAPWSSFGTIVSLTDEKVTSITLNHTEATLTEGQTLTLTATIAPGYATNKAVTWSSSNTSVATVDNTGKVTAIAPGTATITATAGDGSGVSASCVVTVEAMPTEVTITINQYGSATYCSEYALDFSNVEGLKAYAATGYNNITGIVTLTRVMTTQPGTGLFLKGEPGTYEVPMMETSADHTINMLVGTLAPTLLNKTSDDGLYANFKYTIKNGETEPMFYQFADGSTMGAGKAYLQIPTAWLPAGETRSIGLRFDEGEGTTDMEEFTIDNSQLTIIYDLFGRRVAQPVKGGIYIVNGKKVIVK